ncbi:hypothetical protein [Mycoplasma sp. P36-A1]|uniref:hypothetical protein n=1 Tax=Mycoplasma sp. P36-A1 TaxID=3252900 RepID=UPI003C2E602D
MNNIANFFNPEINPYSLYIIIGIIVIIAVIAFLIFRNSVNKEKDFDEILPLPFEINTLEQYLGGLANINSVEGSISKVAFKLKDTKIIQLEEIKKLGASGIVETKAGFTFIFGSISKTIAILIQKDLDNIESNK